MPRPNKQQILEDLQGLSPEEQEQYLDALDKMYPVGAQAAAAGAQSISPTPAFDKPLYIPGMGIVPSPSTLTDLIPGVGGALGALLGGPPGAAAGAGTGEVARMGIRKAAGYAPATGVVQEMAGLDPNSPATAALNVGIEAAGGGLTEGLIKWLAKIAPASLRESALQSYARAAAEDPRNIREVAQLTETLRPIQNDLPGLGPLSPRDTMLNVAEHKIKTEAGPRVQQIFGKEGATKPSSFLPAAAKLKGEARELVLYPEHEAISGVDEYGDLITEMKSATYRTPEQAAIASDLRQRASDLRDLEKNAVSFKLSGGMDDPSMSFEDAVGEAGPTVSDVWETRKALDEAILLKKGEGAYDAASRELRGPVRAARSARQGLRDILHSENLGMGARGKEADEVFTAWQAVKEGGQLRDPGTFLERWMLSRLVGGPVGTAVGAAATKPAFWYATSSKTKRGLANALEAGDKQKLAQLLRGVFEASVQPEEE